MTVGSSTDISRLLNRRTGHLNIFFFFPHFSVEAEIKNRFSLKTIGTKGSEKFKMRKRIHGGWLFFLFFLFRSSPQMTEENSFGASLNRINPMNYINCSHTVPPDVACWQKKRRNKEYFAQRQWKDKKGRDKKETKDDDEDDAKLDDMVERMWSETALRKCRYAAPKKDSWESGEQDVKMLVQCTIIQLEDEIPATNVAQDEDKELWCNFKFF